MERCRTHEEAKEISTQEESFENVSALQEEAKVMETPEENSAQVEAPQEEAQEMEFSALY